jgi:uncharacterized protein YecE (DUF72 family)
MPDDFVLAWKASRFITHWKQLRENSRSSLALMESRLRVLEPKVGPILFQLLSRLDANCDKLRKFIQIAQLRFEFWHPSWFEPPILKVLSDADIALCFSDRDAPTPWEVTAPFVYNWGYAPGGF